MNWLITAALCVVFVEIFLHLPFAAALAELRHASRKAARTIRIAGVSDHWKEKAMGAYARTTFLATLRLAAFLGLVVVVAVASIFTVDRFLAAGFEAFVLGWIGIAWSLVAATVYVLIRRALARDRL